MKKQIAYEDIELTVLSYQDIDEIMNIQESTFAIMDDKRILRRNTIETFSVCFEAPSITYGVRYKGKLIAFGMLYLAGDTDENLAKELDNFDKADLWKTANIKVIIVLPEWRGNGLQRFLIEKLEAHAKQQQVRTLLATVSPLNTHSLDNFNACGYTQIKTIMKYGGLSRVLLIKDL